MITRRFLVAALAALCLAGAAWGESISWRTDLSTALAEAKKSNRLVMVDVYTDWCGWCKKLDSDTYADAKVAARAKDFVALKLNPEKSAGEKEFAQRYAVSGYPTILFVEADGTLVNKVVGYRDAPGFLAAMETTTASREKVKGLFAEFRAGNYTGSQALLDLLLQLGRTDEAADVFQRAAGSLQPPFRAAAAVTLARGLAEGGSYDAALGYLKIAEGVTPETDTTRQAYYLHSVVLYYAQGKPAAAAYLEHKIADARAPAEWKKKYRELKEQMETAKD
jgi:thioredoxin-related protein